jgi:hypothetical protein
MISEFSDERYPVVTFHDSDGQESPGGQCRCCGAGPNPDNDFYIHKAGLCDSDGIFYSMLCRSCLDDILAKYGKRKRSLRDQKAQLVTELLGDDLDGMEAMMEDLPDFDQLMDED